MLPADMTQILRELARRAVTPEPPPYGFVPAEPTPSDTRGLIAHIVERYHDAHRREFPAAIRLARKVEAVHAGDPRCPRGLADHLLTMSDELEAHQQREEKMLFPTMLNGSCAVVRFPIIRMMAEHAEVEEQLARLRVLTHGFTAPKDACATWRELSAACRKLHDDLIEHMRLENEVLFPRFLP